MAKPAARHPLELARSVAFGIARRLPSHVDIDDLISAGSLGYAKAASIHDPVRGPLDAFAILKIRGAILDFLRQGPGTPRRTRKNTQDKMPFIVGMESLPEVSIESVAFEAVHVQRMLPRLAGALLQLEERLRYIVERNYYDDVSIEEIAAEMGVSPSRISQLRTKALNKLRESLDVTNAD